MLGLHGFPDLVTSERFNERRPGLDHISFGCANRGELEKWAARLDEVGVVHGEIVDAGYGSGLSFRDPDNIQLELFYDPSITAPAQMSSSGGPGSSRLSL